jgi:ferritin-like protein
LLEGNDMTKLLEKAFDETAKLPDDEQDALAQAVLAELVSERRWDELFAGSTDVLSELAEEALAEHRAGRTKPLDPDRL